MVFFSAQNRVISLVHFQALWSCFSDSACETTYTQMFSKFQSCIEKKKFRTKYKHQWLPGKSYLVFYLKRCRPGSCTIRSVMSWSTKVWSPIFHFLLFISKHSPIFSNAVITDKRIFNELFIFHWNFNNI